MSQKMWKTVDHEGDKDTSCKRGVWNCPQSLGKVTAGIWNNTPDRS